MLGGLIPGILVACWLIYAHFNLPKIYVRKLTGRGGYNTLTRAIVDPRVTYPIAVLGQEVFESRWKKWPHRLIFNATDRGIRERELRGHEAEVQVAEILGLRDNETLEEHRARKAFIIKRGYAKSFSDWSEEEIVEAMRKHTKKCRKWALRWAGTLEKEYHKNYNRVG